MMRSFVALALLAGSADALVVSPGCGIASMPAASARASVVAQAPRYNDPILDESKPDPVFDDDFEYLGSSKAGFVTFAEAMNGRAAMMGFTIMFLQELIFGKGVLEMYGLPYDAGAVLMQ